MARLTAQQRLERAKLAKARAEAEIRSAAGKLRAEDRRRETRRKILLGGVLLAQARTDERMRAWIERAVAAMPERDRAIFEE